MRVLVVDDEPAVRDAVGLALESEGYVVRAVGDGARALVEIDAWRPDAVVLDVAMPYLDGLDACRRLRSTGDRTPILMLTARDAVGDRVDGLDAGADDYLVKPFDLDELLARVRALLRRAYPDDPAVLRHADLVVDPAARTARRGDRVIEFSRTEFALLEVLLRNANHALPREVIIERVWGRDFGPGSNSLEVYVRYLRRKLEAGGEPRLIHTVRGVGYRLGAP
ncbi:two-component system, OmpR family, response regulator MprA [Streptoalloteichus tenebrarius]|uniref:Two-component system, OmpR family, response regulator MprA n=1 Tax=Streptoalloteichus tenebrarius (strain ATCC 17920 / DSM 40477 / JCM 4838 / CBS 697.72 / NBRC 16177 / NCIMB 11028 / NRRL B-12390 / A12253. 1 / ISP 5477) TaxID=1933 RepID=A0ABT1HMM5_STRSD|nr:response regulator transcription factor [Streptoalloteichus tenebrarius]MCP2256776.1 two-component system, OmpR family, response regulator MprA [Streptoalloteichus tenebrarius]BFF00319.1 response regulator transcription factor [Streptoalloteichus tenebrarius]